MSTFDIQSALNDLRIEIQTDRIALQRTISDGFSDVQDRMDEHLKHVTNLDVRLTTVEDRQTLFGRGLWSTFITLIGIIATWAISLLKAL
jgi:hypothetical protein